MYNNNDFFNEANKDTSNSNTYTQYTPNFIYENAFENATCSPNKKKPRKFLKFFAIILLCASSACTGVFGGIYAYKNYFINTDTSKSNVIYSLQDGDTKSLSINTIAAMNEDSVVEIKTEKTKSDFWFREYVIEGAGSGVVATQDGYIITNMHVIDGASKITVTFSKTQKQYDAQLVGTSNITDIAVLKIAPEETLKPVAFGNAIETGEPAIVVGNPLGSLGGTVTAGIVSSIDRIITIDGQTLRVLQTDASVNPGNSGGAMFNDRGELIGIVVAKSNGTDIEGLGFAIPINIVKEEIAKIITF